MVIGASKYGNPGIASGHVRRNPAGRHAGDRERAVSGGGPVARYQNVETHPSARRQGLAGTLVYRAGRYGLDTLGARARVMVADPGYSAIRIYRSVGFTDRETQVELQRESPRP